MNDYVAEFPPDVSGGDDKALGQTMKKSMAQLRAAPPLMQHRMLSPYLHGQAFIAHFRRDGWERINRIYRDFPLSSEQIMHPRKYYPRRDFPKRITLAGLPSDGTHVRWRRATGTTIGEIGVMALVETWGQLLEDPTLARSAGKVAAGWDGDCLVRFEDRADARRTTVVLVTTWDTPEDADEMHDACLRWARWWSASDEDRRGATVARPSRGGRPGLDVICVLTETPRPRPGFVPAIPAYTRTTVRSLSGPEDKP